MTLSARLPQVTEALPIGRAFYIRNATNIIPVGLHPVYIS